MVYGNSRKEEIEAFLQKQRIPFNIAGNNYMISCPFHQDENPSCGISFNGVWNCFSCGKKGSWRSFLEIFGEEIKPLSFRDVVHQRLNNDHERRTVFESQSLPSDFRKYSTVPLKVLERISTADVQNFGIGEARQTHPGYFIIPIKIEGYESYVCRHLFHKPAYAKRWLYPKGFTKVLFPPPDNKVILVEGLIGMMAAVNFGHLSSCCFGHFLSDFQIEQLITAEVEEVTILFDSYEEHYKDSIKNTFMKLYTVAQVYLMGLRRDPDEVQMPEFYRAYDNRLDLSGKYEAYKSIRFTKNINGRMNDI